MIIVPEMIGSVVGVYVSAASIAQVTGILTCVSERQIFHHCRGQARNDRSLPRRVLVSGLCSGVSTADAHAPYRITYKPVGHGRGANMKDSRL
jgi:hypothetical protein